MPTDQKKLLALHTRLAALAASTANLEKLLKLVLEAILKFFQADSGSIMIYSPHENRLILYRSIQQPGAPLKKKIQIGEGIAGEVFQTGKAILVENIAQAPLNLALRRPESSGSFLSLPLTIAKRVIGVLNLNRPGNGEGFRKNDLELANTIQAQIAGIVEKARLLDEVERRNSEVESLYGLTSVLYEGKDFQKTLQAFLEKLTETLHFHRTAILIFNPEDNDKPFDILASFRFGPSDMQRISESIHSRLQEIIRERTPEPSWEEEMPITLSFREQGKDMGLFFLPLPLNQPRKHFLVVSRLESPGDPEAIPEQYRFLNLVSRQLSIAFERNNLIERITSDQKILMDSNYQNRIYLDISMELASTLDPHLVLRKAFDQFGRLIPYTSITILLYNDLDGEYQAIVQPYSPLSPSYLKALNKKLVDTIQDYPIDPPHPPGALFSLQVYTPQNADLPTARNYKQEIALPIVLGKKIIGLIHLANRQNIPYRARELDITTQFTGIFITSIKNAIIHRRTEKLAYTDPLTTLFNHRYFQETLTNEFVRAKRYEKPLSLMILDIDHFKRFNDTYGHLVGDQVLRHVARIFQNAIREKIDTVARYGGEEFAVLLPETDLNGGLNFGNRIRHAMEKAPFQGETGELSVTVSIGVSCTTVTQCSKTSELIEAADKALYQAKDQGRNRVIAFEKAKIG